MVCYAVYEYFSLQPVNHRWNFEGCLSHTANSRMILSPCRTSGQAIAQTVAVIFTQQFGISVCYSNGTLVTGFGTYTAFDAFFLINLDNLSDHISFKRTHLIQCSKFDKMRDDQACFVEYTPRIIFLTILRLCDTIF